MLRRLLSHLKETSSGITYPRNSTLSTIMLLQYRMAGMVYRTGPRLREVKMQKGSGLKKMMAGKKRMRRGKTTMTTAMYLAGSLPLSTYLIYPFRWMKMSMLMFWIETHVREWSRRLQGRRLWCASPELKPERCMRAMEKASTAVIGRMQHLLGSQQEHRTHLSNQSLTGKLLAGQSYVGPAQRP